MFRPLLAFALALSLAGYTAPAHAADPDFKAMMRKVLDAWQTLDPTKAGVYYSKESDTVYYDVFPLKYTGWNAYAAGTKDTFQDWTSLTVSLNDDAWIERHGDVAITAVTGRGEVVEKSGKTSSIELRWTAFWEKKGNDWLISHDHLSAPLPMGPPEATPAAK
jgi:ketosteroid isomerase-like protein